MAITFVSDAEYYYNTDRRDTSLSVCTYGYHCSVEPYHWGPKQRPYYIINHISSGEGVYEYQGIRHKINAGDTFVSYPKGIISIHSSGPFEFRWISFTGGEAAILLKRLGFTEKTPILGLGIEDTFVEIFSHISNIQGTQLDSATGMVGWLYLLFSEMLKKNPDFSASDKSEDPFELALAYIQKNFKNNINIDDICIASGISRSWLYRLFMNNIGIPPIEYLKEMKINHACQLLLNTDSRISEIAEYVGFADPLYFSRIFRGSKGISPSQYRQYNKSHST